MEKIEPYENKNEKDKVESIYEQLKNIMKDKFQSIGAKTTTDRPYSDQNNDTSLAKVGNRTWYMNEAYNPISGESYAFTCWIADPKEGAVLDPSEFEKFGTPWEDKCKSVWQIHGSSRVGFQVQEIIENGNGKLGPRIVYTTKKDHVEVETGFDKDMPATSRIS